MYEWKIENGKCKMDDGFAVCNAAGSRVSITLHFTLYILHSLLRFPDYDPAPRHAPRGMSILYQKFTRANGRKFGMFGRSGYAAAHTEMGDG